MEGTKEASSKFQTFKMSAGRVEDFHNGLQGRVGKPHAPAVDPSMLHIQVVTPFDKPMLQEPRTPT